MGYFVVMVMWVYGDSGVGWYMVGVVLSAVQWWWCGVFCDDDGVVFHVMLE